MVGWWDPASPVAVVKLKGAADGEEMAGGGPVRATLYIGGGGTTFALALANWSPRTVSFSLAWNATKLGELGAPRGASVRGLSAPTIERFQPSGSWEAGGELKLRGKGSGYNEGWLLRLDVR